MREGGTRRRAESGVRPTGARGIADDASYAVLPAPPLELLGGGILPALGHVKIAADSASPPTAEPLEHREESAALVRSAGIAPECPDCCDARRRASLAEKERRSVAALISSPASPGGSAPARSSRSESSGRREG